MKFAKVLFFVCAIGICAAAGLERTVSKAESEYMAATKAAKAEVGYKEMMQNMGRLDDLAFSNNHRINLSIDAENVDASLDVNLIKSTNFNSGIPIFFSNVASVASKSIMNNWIKYDEKTYYIPFNTISGVFELLRDMNSVVKTKCYLSNKNGKKPLIIAFKDLSDSVSTNFSIVNAINRKINEKAGSRKAHIQNAFGRVADGIFDSNYFNEQILSINKSDAEIKRKKQENIAKIKKQIADLTATKTALEARKITISQEVQVVQTKISETTNIRIKKIAYKLSIEATIKTLREQISPQETLKKLNDNINSSMNKLKYWLQGSVYHRVISETEMTGLIGMALNDSQFDGKVNDYFFPQ